MMYAIDEFFKIDFNVCVCVRLCIYILFFSCIVTYQLLCTEQK